MVNVAAAWRVDAEQLAQVMVAHVLEVPAHTEIARRAQLPHRVVHAKGVAAWHARQRAGLRHVGKRQTLGGECDGRAACVLYGPAVGTDAVVRTGADIALVRKRAAMGAGGPIRHVR